jgi:AmmeMemoRadiSam system protein A
MSSELAEKRLLTWALHAVTAFVHKREAPCAPSLPELGGAFGLFVTLRVGPELRGCMGRIGGIDDLVAILPDVARSALADPRFAERRIQVEELDQLHVELSILSELEPFAGPEELEIGRDGILVEFGGKSGLFLPQVGPEQGWDATQLLEMCCRHKLGMPAGTWQQPGAKLWRFEANVLQ